MGKKLRKPSEIENTVAELKKMLAELQADPQSPRNCKLTFTLISN